MLMFIKWNISPNKKMIQAEVIRNNIYQINYFPNFGTFDYHDY